MAIASLRPKYNYAAVSSYQNTERLNIEEM